METASAATVPGPAPGAIETAESTTVDRPLSLPSQLYVEHDAAVVARSSGQVESILADIGSAGDGRPAARPAREHRPGDRPGPGPRAGRQRRAARGAAARAGSGRRRDPGGLGAGGVRAPRRRSRGQEGPARLRPDPHRRAVRRRGDGADGAGAAAGQSGRLAVPGHRARAGAGHGASAGDRVRGPAGRARRRGC